MSLIVKLGKKGKRIVRKIISPNTKPSISYCRRIEKIKTNKRIVAMTFDDGPADVPCSPDLFGGRSLTDVLLDTLNKYGAKGTFDVVGSTAENYPDRAGKLGSALWGGEKYDHYPDMDRDGNGGALVCERLIRRMIDEGHQITNHGYCHRIFGKKPFVYAKRVSFSSFDEVTEDLSRLDSLMREKYSYEMTLSRPPHYVDNIAGGFSSYDAYEKLGYNYLAASFDGMGWLPSVKSDAKEAYDAEVREMTEPLKRLLENDPDALCGAIIFQKDGYNMAKRTPVASGLDIQLELLYEYGYRVVTVDELMRESPFADVGREDADFEKLVSLSKDHAIVYSDNTLRLSDTMTYGELAMLLCPKNIAVDARLEDSKKKYKKRYAAACGWCIENGLIPANAKPEAKIGSLPEKYFGKCADLSRRSVLKSFIGEV